MHSVCCTIFKKETESPFYNLLFRVVCHTAAEPRCTVPHFSPQLQHKAAPWWGAVLLPALRSREGRAGAPQAQEADSISAAHSHHRRVLSQQRSPAANALLRLIHAAPCSCLGTAGNPLQLPRTHYWAEHFKESENEAFLLNAWLGRITHPFMDKVLQSLVTKCWTAWFLAYWKYKVFKFSPLKWTWGEEKPKDILHILSQVGTFSQEHLLR